MARRSKGVQDFLDVANKLLTQTEDIMITGDNGYLKPVKPDSEEAILFKQGIVEAIEILLRKTNSYRGYTYQHPYQETTKFNRIYY